jgi:hypothetical protein
VYSASKRSVLSLLSCLVVLFTGCVRSEEDELSAEEATAPPVSVLTQHNDLSRTGANLSETILTTKNVNVGHFGKLFSRKVSGYIYAQPLVAAGAISGKNVVYVATESNNVYAFDADDPAASTALAHVRVDPPMPETDVPGYPNCKDLNPSHTGETDPLEINKYVGITGTPVIDATAKVMYVAAKTKITDTAHPTGVVRYYLYTLALDTLKVQHKVELTATVTASGDGSSGGKLTFDPTHHLNRVALTLSKGVVYVGFASHCDANPYHGWIFRYDTVAKKLLAPYVTTPSTSRGGIWMGGGGLAVDSGGDLYFTAGNTKPTDTNTSGKAIANALARVTINTSGALVTKDWFMPSNVADLDTKDLDLDSAGVLLIPGTNLVVGGGKESKLFLLNRSALGKFNATDKVVQEFFVEPGTAKVPDHEIAGTPVYWDRAATSRLYVWPVRAPLKAYAFDGSKFNPTPQSVGRRPPTAIATGLEARCPSRPMARKRAPGSSGRPIRCPTASTRIRIIRPCRASFTPSTPKTCRRSCGTASRTTPATGSTGTPSSARPPWPTARSTWPPSRTGWTYTACCRRRPSTAASPTSR